MVISTLPDGKIVTMEELEDNILRQFNKRHNIKIDFWDTRVRYIDKMVLNTESYQLRGFQVNNYPLLNQKISPLPPKESYLLFIDTLGQYFDLSSDSLRENLLYHNKI
jgi:hypothetical protein